MDEQRRPIPGAAARWDPADEKAALLGVLMDAARGCCFRGAEAIDETSRACGSSRELTASRQQMAPAIQ